ncbi:MAG: hydantoinase/oxoprolinase N-terminal domain-containing protein [Candidatus Puniceispirillaceae bacterium]
MTLVLGLDTGGTFTDAALVDTSKANSQNKGDHNSAMIAKAKSLTTRQDLSIGVGGAMKDVVTSWGGNPNDISLVSLSTTLATNAVVEGVGGRVGLILIGFDEGALERADLAKALGNDPHIFVNGGHRNDGSPLAPLDIKMLTGCAKELASDVSAFAVASHFATRNPEHEIAAREILRDLTGLPVTCSHELSSSLGGPRRALTAMLNARLINLLERLISATSEQMAALGLTCPLMVVKGDGSLLHADFARTRPVETVLSGPAASQAGAAFLAGASTALVSDIGGTTTDIAYLREGAPGLNADGAFVGGWRTMVEAADIRTSGLGGDSEVTPQSRGLQKGLTLGPRRAIPLSLLAKDWPEAKIHLEQQLQNPVPQATDGRFIMPVMPNGIPDWLSKSETRFAEAILEAGTSALADIATSQVALGAVDRLISRGLVALSAFTPTDAAHVLGKFDNFDSQAAYLGAQLLSRQKNGIGEVNASSPEDISQDTLDTLTERSALALLDAAFAQDGWPEGTASANTLVKQALQHKDDHQKLVKNQLSLSLPVIALGASSGTHYPAIAAMLGAELIVPEHADVAGAVGAAAGSVRQRVMITVTQPGEGKFRVHLPDGPKDITSQEEALELASQTAQSLAEARAKQAGAARVDITVSQTIKDVVLSENKTLFIEGIIQAQAVGVPTA